MSTTNKKIILDDDEEEGQKPKEEKTNENNPENSQNPQLSTPKKDIIKPKKLPTEQKPQKYSDSQKQKSKEFSRNDTSKKEIKPIKNNNNESNNKPNINNSNNSNNNKIDKVRLALEKYRVIDKNKNLNSDYNIDYYKNSSYNNYNDNKKNDIQKNNNNTNSGLKNKTNSNIKNKDSKKNISNNTSIRKESKDQKDKKEEEKNETINKSENKDNNKENKKSEKETLNKKRNRDSKDFTTSKDEKLKEKKPEISKKPKKVISDDEDEDENEENVSNKEQKSYSSSSSSSYSSYSSKTPKKSTPKKILTKKKIIKNKSKKENYTPSLPKSGLLKPKGKIVRDLLCRWWYAISWPPENYDVSEKLKENKLRNVQISDWKKEPKIKDDLKKCIELSGYKYVFMDYDGKTYDFRPEELKPSYNNLIKLPEIKLQEYLVVALKKQLEQLEEKNTVEENDLKKRIKEKLAKAEKHLSLLKDK